ncbi:CPBP family intramembrane metalloprotease [Aureisphaera galaxeae]|uniref:CPBP family intramembrane glutamic endopeptidase n=1 Tax=Aureisphaera galaxeae TaxID=1538023 RepID=UPI00234FDB0F|nr:CPBP family intramembrane glutamic endopeptidase [Aureisphaera galaxeae]MDC8005706.1 CPBP family intramembrane metalloprotease [Aureisphaera galaxeae]
MNTLSNNTKYLEILAVILTAAGKFVFMDYLNWRLPYVSFAVLSWTLYILYRKRRTPGILKYWGFRKDNFRRALRWVLPFGIFSVAVFLTIGIWQGSLNLTWHIFPILITYPLWGIIQQFLLIALVAGNLKDGNRGNFKNWQIILGSAVLFSLVHYPSVWLMLGTFILALFYGFVYLKERNVYVLGLFHGWLGAIFYYTVVGTDPFEDAFLPLLT